MNDETLTQRLEQIHARAYEVMPLADLADDIVEFETYHGVECTDSEIRTAYRDSVNCFIDAVIQNYHDTPESERDESESDFLAHWEPQRPENRRRAHIRSLAE